MKKTILFLFIVFIISGFLTSSSPMLLLYSNLYHMDIAGKQSFVFDKWSRTKENPYSGKLSVHFLDVGQGDSILVMTPSNKVVLIDTAEERKGTTIANYLKALRIKQIDKLIITHPHSDHIGGMGTIMNRFKITEMIVSESSFYNPIFNIQKGIAERKATAIKAVQPGSCFKFDDVNFSVVAPNGKQYGYQNDFSLVIKLSYGKNSFLLAGDSQFVSEEEMLSRGYDLKSDVLKVGHHGSDGSTSTGFLKAVSPKYAVISVGKGNSFGHPHKAVLDRIEENKASILRTDLEGDIVFVADGQKITWEKSLKKAS